jgi:hypothetical protein
VANGYGYSATLEIQRAEELVGKALAASPRNWFAHYAKGSLRRVVQHRCEEAIPAQSRSAAHGSDQKRLRYSPLGRLARRR